MIPITEDCGVWHPQEGVFNGHFQPREAQKINRIGQLRQGVLKTIENENVKQELYYQFRFLLSALRIKISEDCLINLIIVFWQYLNKW